MKSKTPPLVQVSDVGGGFLPNTGTPTTPTPTGHSGSPADGSRNEARHDRYERKQRCTWRIGRMSPQRDSGSESAPLLSSGSHASFGQVMFHDSETSDLDSSPDDGSSKYGSVGAASFNSVATVLPKRLPPLVDSPLMSPTNVSSSLPYAQERCYEIYDTELLLADEKFEVANDSQGGATEFTRAFLPGSLTTRDPSPAAGRRAGKHKQNSLVTIFSIWNTILGSSLLTMPWGILMAGLIPGIILVLVMGALCLYTTYRLLRVHKSCGGGDGIEVIDLCRTLLGPWAEYMAKIFSIMVLLGANVAYWVLMSNFLYNSVNFLYDSITGQPMYFPITNESVPPEVLCPKEDSYNNSDIANKHDRSYDNLGPVWDLYKTVPIFLALLIFPLLNFSSPTFFTKFNSLGTASIVYLIVFVVVKSASWGVNMDETAWETSWTLHATFPALSGMLALSFFIHNIIITIMQSNRNQEKNGRDLTIAYVLVTVTYTTVGTIFYICFPLAKSCIEDNLLNNFQKWDGLTVGARIVLLFQLFTVYPLISYMLRIQLLSSVLKTSNCARTYVLLVNLVVVSICVLFATFMPRIGTIVRYTGAMSGLIYVFTLPSLLHLVIAYRQRTLNMLSIIFHLAIPVVGGSNLVAQFFVRED